jgi:6-phosphogluconolactonase (cycloisomerase 2 family)
VRRLVHWSAAIAAVAASLLAPARSAAAPAGALIPLPPPGGCIGSPTFFDGSTCALGGRGLYFVHHVELSPDGRFLYSAAGNEPIPPADHGAIGIFARNARTGPLHQLTGTNGCVKRPGAADGDEECAIGTGVHGIRHVTISADGRFLYGSGYQGIAIFRRDRAAGTLHELTCMSEDEGDPCQPIPATRMTEDLVISPDGRFAYAVSSTYSTVTIYRRSPITGLLQQIPGPAGCLVESGAAVQTTAGCTPVHGIGTARGLTLQRDGRVLYVAAIADSLAIFRRDARTGLLKARGCLAERAEPGCRGGRGLYGLHRISFSPDERFAYAAGKRGQVGGSSIDVFRHDARTGALVQLPGKAGCFTSSVRADCGTGRIIQGAHQALPSPDGRTLYVSSDNTFGGIGVWRINPKTGRIHQLPGRYGCVDDRLNSGRGCANAPRAGGIHIAAIDPGGRFLYGAGEDSRAITGFRIAR